MRAKLPMLLVFIAAASCSVHTPPAREANAGRPVVVEPEPHSLEAKPALPAETLAAADHAYGLQLSASRGQFDVERQVAVLKEAVLLYRQFLERADGRPELEPAVRKSRERIADAEATIVFLEASLRTDREPRAGGLEPVVPKTD